MKRVTPGEPILLGWELAVPTKKSISLINSCKSTRIWRWTCAPQDSVLTLRRKIGGYRGVETRRQPFSRARIPLCLSRSVSQELLKQPCDNIDDGVRRPWARQQRCRCRAARLHAEPASPSRGRDAFSPRGSTRSTPSGSVAGVGD